MIESVENTGGVGVAGAEREKLDAARKQLAAYRSVTGGLGNEFEQRPDDPWLLTKLGYNYMEIQELELASETFEKALAGDPSSYWIRTGLAACYAGLGEFAKAGQIHESLYRDGYHRTQVLWGLIQLPTSIEGADVLSALSNLKPPSEADRDAFEAESAFMKATVLDKAGRYSDAWSQLVVANELKDKLLERDFPERSRSHAEDLISLRQNLSAAVIGREEEEEGVPRSLFIFGPSRSGKTTTEALLGAIGGVKRGYENVLIKDILQALKTAGLFGGGRLNKTTPAVRAMFRELYLEQLAKFTPKSVFTNTAPQFILDIYEIVEAVPNARFMFMKRDIDDIALKIYMKNYAVGNAYSYSIPSIFEYVRQYCETIDYVADMLPDVSRVIRYEEMIDDPKAVVDIAAELCGVPTHDGPLPPPGNDRGCAEPYIGFMKAAFAGG